MSTGEAITDVRVLELETGVQGDIEMDEDTATVLDDDEVTVVTEDDEVAVVQTVPDCVVVQTTPVVPPVTVSTTLICMHALGP